MEMVTIRDHEGKVTEMPKEQAVALLPRDTVGWDYLDSNGNWYALRIILVPQGRR
jgi:hypothetical protein